MTVLMMLPLDLSPEGNGDVGSVSLSPASACGGGGLPNQANNLPRPTTRQC
jgi:hypothetical protein